ncbi:MAG: hypothetical protein GTO55_02230 [Armatimonadetes bacterium]|nr:hypothetical protein [Armatimonadota bacterium]NIM23096.1 hypothetical protein [Armatimonadota bacterium]NIM66964.1 hypothetical protein [Armatimonadota bacterium]NIM75498.1 hypothetical protein [Armatimonadota bacterium]NIN05155.1 hypothetical protein [Armatimonadota bacterium]
MTLGRPLGTKRRSLKYRLSVGVAIVVVIAVWFLFELWFIWSICHIVSSISRDVPWFTAFPSILLLALVIVIIVVIVRARAKRTSRR